MVPEINRALDPARVDRGRKTVRRRYYFKGPNYVWHMNSYDKLKFYGIAIGGCIDDFSRKIVLLHANDVLATTQEL